jgi:hypothetical protein
MSCRQDCEQCGEPIASDPARCLRCGRECHRGRCDMRHAIACAWHHCGICDSSCRFCAGGVIAAAEALGG